MKRNELMIILMVAVTVMTAYTVMADPNIPAVLSQLSTSTRTIDGANKTNDALAGNLTEIAIDDTKVTQGWQGYYGNVSGTIVLDDALNNSMYTWDQSSASGEIYASRNFSIDFSSGQIVCANTANVSIENTAIFPGTAGNDADNVTNTFSQTTHPEIVVGSNTITADSCSYTLSTYVDDAADATRTFNETLLYSKNMNSIIYTAIIAQDAEGFKSGTDSHDFQMLVGEDGHSGDTATTTYYFYVELSA
ncbi:MAG: hypothetical protein GXP63_01745 [DPANN group archaeon]|nr:hypothetical protein [DPANN group archaeon]